MKKKGIMSMILAVALVMIPLQASAADAVVSAATAETEDLGQLSITKGASTQLAQTDSRSVTYQYESSDTNIAAVDETGAITAAAPGNCKITATAYWKDIAVGTKITEVTVTAEQGSGPEDEGPESNDTEPTVLPEDITRFVYDGTRITVIEGTDTKYTMVDRSGDEVEASGTDAEGNLCYEPASGDVVSVEIGKKGGSYAFEGTASDSSIRVKKEASADTILYLNGLSMSSSYTAPIVVKKDSAASVSILAVDGTTNTLSDNVNNNDETNVDNEDAENAVIKAKSGSNVIIGGTGTLFIEGNAKNGIKAAANLSIQDITLSVKAVNNGIASDTDMVIKSGDITVEAGNDGIKSCNDEAAVGSITIKGGDITVDSVGDCIQATMLLDIYGGTFDLTAYNGYDAEYDKDDDRYPSAKGLKASGSYIMTDSNGKEQEVDVTKDNKLNISEGTFTINTADDAIHSDGDVTITAGDFHIQSGDDGIHAAYYNTLGKEDAANDELQIHISNSYEGIEGAAVTIYSGTYELYCSDDILNAANADLKGFPYLILIYGGDIYASTTMGDGYDSNGDLRLYGGTHVIMSDTGLGENNEPLDCDGSLTLSGAIVLGIGRAGMGTNISSDSSNAYVTFGRSSGVAGWGPGGQGGQSSSAISILSGDQVAVSDTSGTVIAQAAAYWDAGIGGRSASYVFCSAPSLQSGSSYTLSVDGVSKASATASAGNSRPFLAATEEKKDTKLIANVENAEVPEVLFGYIYTAGNTKVISVSDQGLVTGLKEGETILQVQFLANDTVLQSGVYQVKVAGEIPFTDVTPADWYYDVVSSIYEHEIMIGLTSTTFGPEDEVERGQFATILYRMEGKPDIEYTSAFPDVLAGQFYSEAVTWANQNQIMTGYGSPNYFGTGDSITREQIAAILYRYAGYQQTDTNQRADLSIYEDAGMISDFAQESIQWCAAMGIIRGKDAAHLDPQGSASRAECAAMIIRFMEREK